VANWFTRLFQSIKRGITAFVEAARRRGLTDEIVNRALAIVIEAAQKHEDPTARREYAVAALMLLFPTVSESILRVAVELAVQAWKDRQARPEKVEP
jgi:hypothetical protein